ncbi:MAG: non-homologous end-joining DNA ligase, partial [Pseudomonadota bacterium]|nr:non-homologous end-joining DNA ligase [Pseudomonadota bacterium]
IEIAGVRLTHPDRVLYPEQGLTKADLARFYVDIAEHVLPHLRERPLSLLRCPRGKARKCFFQKHMDETLPPGLGRVSVPEKNGRAEYVVVEDIAGLVGLVQLGVLELHPWGSRTDRLEQPDMMTFDLDPDPGLDFTDVIAAAREVRALLLELGLTSFVKTTGGKGLHVVVPLTRRASWDEVKTFARALAGRLNAAAPARYTDSIRKAQRQGRIFIDYLRNGRGATAVAAYTTRARTGAPVATPLRWDELGRLRSGAQYDVGNLRRRLAALREDPWEGFFRQRQSITQAARRAVGLA